MHVQDDVLYNAPCCTATTFEFTIHLMFVGLLSTALFQYLKCQDQRVSKNGRSTFVFCSSWNLWGGPILKFNLPGGTTRTPAPPSVTPLIAGVTFKHRFAGSVLYASCSSDQKKWNDLLYLFLTGKVVQWDWERATEAIGFESRLGHAEGLTSRILSVSLCLATGP